mmetsp:Transcript_30860/g.64735  ORF Transcript_30860/g.64735 Transcript_30860/m.64735 type:complete len:286 (+) Transcript_30860:332-1189(+)
MHGCGYRRIFETPCCAPLFCGPLAESCFSHTTHRQWFGANGKTGVALGFRTFPTRLPIDEAWITNHELRNEPVRSFPFCFIESAHESAFGARHRMPASFRTHTHIPESLLLAFGLGHRLRRGENNAEFLERTKPQPTDSIGRVQGERNHWYAWQQWWFFVLATVRLLLLLFCGRTRSVCALFPSSAGLARAKKDSSPSSWLDPGAVLANVDDTHERFELLVRSRWCWCRWWFCCCSCQSASKGNSREGPPRNPEEKDTPGQARCTGCYQIKNATTLAVLVVVVVV